MVRIYRPSPTGFLVRCSAQTSPLFVVEQGRQWQHKSVYSTHTSVLCDETLVHQSRSQA